MLWDRRKQAAVKSSLADGSVENLWEVFSGGRERGWRQAGCLPLESEVEIKG